MKKRLIASLLSLSVIILLGAQIASASFGPIATTGDIANVQTQLNNLSSELAALKNTADSNFVFGANNTQPIAGTNYSLAGSGVSATAGSIVLTSFTITQTGVPITSAMLSTNFYITLEPGNTARQEIAACTGVIQNSNGTATLTGCSRGLLPFPPYTASSSYAFPHGGGTTLILSNPPQLYNELAAIGNTEAITGLWTFASSAIPLYNGAPSFTNPLQIIDKAYVDGVASSGAPDAGIGSKGLVAITTPSGAATSTDGSQVLFNVIGKQYYASSSQATTSVVMTTPSGTLADNFIGQSASDTYNFKGNTTIASATFNGTTVIGGQNVTSTSFSKFGGTGVTGALSLSGTTTSTINLSNAPIVIENYTSISITGSSTLLFSNPATNGSIVILKSQGNCTLTSSAASGTIVISNLGATAGNYGNGLTSGPGVGVIMTGTFAVSGPSTESVDTSIGGQGKHVGSASTAAYSVFAGAGGSGGSQNTGTGGQGGGGLLIECGGSLNFTGTINANGANGGNGSGSGGGLSYCSGPGGGSNTDGGAGSCGGQGTGSVGSMGAGGGGAGSTVILYNGSLVANTGTINVTGGSGGTGTMTGATGGNGFSYIGQNTEY